MPVVRKIIGLAEEESVTLLLIVYGLGGIVITAGWAGGWVGSRAGGNGMCTGSRNMAQNAKNRVLATISRL